MGTTTPSKVMVTPTITGQTRPILGPWHNRQSTRQPCCPPARSWPKRRLRALTSISQSPLPSLMPSNVSSAKNSPLSSTLDLAVHVTLPGSAR